jgi:hypothetical protein
MFIAQLIEEKLVRLQHMHTAVDAAIADLEKAKVAMFGTEPEPELRIGADSQFTQNEFASPEI